MGKVSRILQHFKFSKSDLKPSYSSLESIIIHVFVFIVSFGNFDSVKKLVSAGQNHYGFNFKDIGGKFRKCIFPPKMVEKLMKVLLKSFPMNGHIISSYHYTAS
jgi:hypothetical protein